MPKSDPGDRLTQINTRWTLVLQANQGGDETARAQQELVARYGGAVYRYLLGMLRDAHLAEDFAQEFALRLVRGDYGHATPTRGRFRDFLKTSLRHLVIDHWRRKCPGPLPEYFTEPRDDNDPASDRTFLERWREELLERAWEGLAAAEREAKQPFYTLLRYKVDHPELRSYQIAEQLGAQLGKPTTETAVRKTLQRARERFGELLLGEVARSIGTARREDIEAELGELNLLTYCQSALERYLQKEE
ncbi:MAG: sigma-70 family RNA polymerase sigma factor [Gemmataceae bacterium]